MPVAVYLLLSVNLASKVAAWLLFARMPWLAAGVWLAADAWVLYHLLVPGAQGIMRTYRSFATARREVWLTIDDGPDPEDTPRVLALLKEHGARATFFVIGQQAAAHPGLIRAIIADGHEVAHHTHTHPLATFWCATPARLRREIGRTLQVLRALGVKPRWFRSPAGVNNFWLQRELDAAGLHCVGWSVRGLEFASCHAADVVARVGRGLAPGSIILLHEGSRLRSSLRVHALRGVLERLRAERYTCVLPSADQLRRASPSRTASQPPAAPRTAPQTASSATCCLDARVE